MAEALWTINCRKNSLVEVYEDSIHVVTKSTLVTNLGKIDKTINIADIIEVEVKKGEIFQASQFIIKSSNLKGYIELATDEDLKKAYESVEYITKIKNNVIDVMDNIKKDDDNVSSSSNVTETPQLQNNKKKPNGCLIIVIVIIALTAVFYIFGGGDDDSSMPTTSSTSTSAINTNVKSATDVVNIIKKQPIAVPSKIDCKLTEGLVTSNSPEWMSHGKYMAEIEYNPGWSTVTTATWYKNQLRSLFYICKSLFSTNDIGRILVRIKGDTIDSNGNKSEDVMIQAAFNKQDFEKVNWDNLETLYLKDPAYLTDKADLFRLSTILQREL